MLGDLGAEVIKIENAARGDDFRRVGPQVAPGQSAPFLWTNRNKQGLALDLKNESGQGVARALIAHADIVVENFTAGVMHRFGLDYESVSTSLMACNAILAALAARARTGRGQRVEVSLFDTAVTMLGFHAMYQLASGAEPTRFGNHSPDTAPMGLFQASDGPLYIACANDQTFRQLAVEVLEGPELSGPDYASNAERVRNRERLAAILNEALGRQTRQH